MTGVGILLDLPGRMRPGTGERAKERMMGEGTGETRSVGPEGP